MVGISEESVVVTGEGRFLPTAEDALALQFTLGADTFTISGGPRPVSAAYRDVATVAVDRGSVLLVLGDGASRLVVERLGSGLGTLVGELRERRARQMLTDRLIDLPADERLELVEYVAGEEHGVAQLAFHPWGAALIPLDERRPWRLVRRADMATVRADQAGGKVHVEVSARPGHDGYRFELLGLGLDAARMASRLLALREAAMSDAAAIVTGLLPDASAASRAQLAGLLVDGRPVTIVEMGSAAAAMESAVLTDPTFAASYAALVGRASDSAGSAALRWLALAPVSPTDPTEHLSWFLVGLPGGLLAFELVSAGAHATYLFRARDSFEAAVFDVSECLIDTRFLRSAIYLTEPALAEARYVRQRLAVATLPSLQAARARFVGRLIHSDEVAWARSLDDAVKWHAANGDETARWPGSDQSEGD